jgi:hypothetical protein
VEPLLQLPELSHNAALLDYLRNQARPPRGPDDYALGEWQLHTHPDLMAGLRSCAPGWPLTAAYGVPVLAAEGIAAVVALGTDWLIIRLGHLPPGVHTEDSEHPEWTFVTGDWHVISPVQDELPGAEYARTCRQLVTDALAHAAMLARDDPTRRRSR